MYPRMAVSGVISSCETSARSWRRAASDDFERMRARRQLVGHPVERSRHGGNLVAAVLGGARGQIAGAEALGCVLHLAQPPPNRAEHDERDHRHADGQHAAANQAHGRPEFANDA